MHIILLKSHLKAKHRASAYSRALRIESNGLSKWIVMHVQLYMVYMGLCVCVYNCTCIYVCICICVCWWHIWDSI